MKSIINLVVVGCVLFFLSSCSRGKESNLKEPTAAQKKIIDTLKNQLYDMPGHPPIIQYKLGGGYETSKTDNNYRWLYFSRHNLTFKVRRKTSIIEEIFVGKYGERRQ